MFLFAPLLALLLTACGAPGGSAEILSAQIQSGAVPQLDARLALAFTPTMLAALDAGIPLTLVFELSGSGAGRALRERRELELAYSPLAARYRWRDLATGTEQSFAHRALLLASLDRVRLPLDAAWQSSAASCTLRVDLARDRLPAPLRLPAWYRADWRFASPVAACQAGT